MKQDGERGECDDGAQQGGDYSARRSPGLGSRDA
jgi:hypothetical protein